MTKPTFDIHSEAYLKFKGMRDILDGYNEPLKIDISDDEDEDANIVSLEVTNKANETMVTMRDDIHETTIHWDGNRLFAETYDLENQTSDKLPVPEALDEIAHIFNDYVVDTGISHPTDEDEYDDEDNVDVDEDVSYPEDDESEGIPDLEDLEDPGPTMEDITPDNRDDE